MILLNARLQRILSLELYFFVENILCFRDVFYTNCNLISEEIVFKLAFSEIIRESFYFPKTVNI